MRVVHVITKGDVGGAQTHVVELARVQVEHRDDVVIVAGVGGPATDRARAEGAEVRIMPSLGEARTRMRMRQAFSDVRSVVAALRPDLVHCHSSHAGLIARMVARRHGVPSVYTAHGWPFQAGAPIGQRAASFAGEFVGGHLGDAVICLTEAERRRALRARVVPASRLWVVPNGIRDVDRELRHRFGDTGAVSIVMVARFAPPKQQLELIEILAGMRELEWTLTFVGDGPQLEECRRLADRRLGDRARFLGHRDDVAAILAEHDVFVLWSAYEGLPISMLEAMRAGLCCVGSDLPGVVELLQPPTAGLVAATSVELQGRLRELLGDRARIRELGARARSRYESSYTSLAMGDATRSVYEAVLARRAGAASTRRTRDDQQ